jgi:hypothetical protein
LTAGFVARSSQIRDMLVARASPAAKIPARQLFMLF